ncbi:MAG: hypothetical protein LLG04_17170, partial [Parachlamydia sp.]|nr:hypothetical protein [Parachlamydia sp.]
MSLIQEAYAVGFAVAAGAVGGTINKMLPPTVQQNLYRFGAVSLISVFLSRTAEVLISKAMGEESENARRNELLTRAFIKMFVPAISTGALGYLVARSGRISEEPVRVATVALTASLING